MSISNTPIEFAVALAVLASFTLLLVLTYWSGWDAGRRDILQSEAEAKARRRRRKRKPPQGGSGTTPPDCRIEVE